MTILFGLRCRLLATAAAAAASSELKKTALYQTHVNLGATMVPFAGYSMPVLYKQEGVKPSVLHCRSSAALFDVGHMGQLKFFGKDRVAFLESLCTSDIASMKKGATKYTLLTNKQGGVVDDSIFTVYDDHIYMVINAGCFDKDVKHISKYLKKFTDEGHQVSMHVHDDLSLMAIQGPKAEAALQKFVDINLSKMKFMSGMQATVQGIASTACSAIVTRCGYTGEDGFEVSVPHSHAPALWNILLTDPTVHPAGLGARDALRLEAGLCLYGHDLNETITPVEADLLFAINKKRREQGGFLGDHVVLAQLKDGVKTIRAGLIVLEGPPAREGAKVYVGESDASASLIGTVCSGMPSPCLGDKCIAMAYIDSKYNTIGTKLWVEVRGKKYPAVVSPTPFVKKGWK